MALVVTAHHGVTGARLCRLPFSALSWADTISGEGSLTVTIPDITSAACIDVTALLREYGVIIAVTDTDSGVVRHAGWLTHFRMADGGAVTLDCGDGWTIWDKRLVINHNLDSGWQDRTVLIDEENPPANWVLTLKGTYRDIARGLLAESLKFGALPYSLPPAQGGSAHERTYQSWDLSTVADRLSDLTDLEDGPELRFDPTIDADGVLTFALNVGAREIIDHTWRWNPSAPGQRVTIDGIDVDGSTICTQSYGTGGKNDDNLMVARHVGGVLTGEGWPVLQTANTEHTTLSVLATLQSYVRADVESGDMPQLTVALKVGREYDVHVGDRVTLTLPDDGSWLQWWLRGTIGSRLNLKVTDVSGDAGSEMLGVQTRVVVG